MSIQCFRKMLLEKAILQVIVFHKWFQEVEEGALDTLATVLDSFFKKLARNAIIVKSSKMNSPKGVVRPELEDMAKALKLTHINPKILYRSMVMRREVPTLIEVPRFPKIIPSPVLPNPTAVIGPSFRCPSLSELYFVFQKAKEDSKTTNDDEEMIGDNI